MNEDKMIVETRQLCKNFGPTIALNHVDLKIYRGQITGLIGENGSGKSTITSILAGMQPATSGEIYYKGELHKVSTMIEGAAKGIGMIVQEQGYVNGITIAQNIILGDPFVIVHGLPLDQRNHSIAAAKGKCAYLKKG